mgnify:FL=1
MDFEGRSDGRSMKTILAHVVPLKLVSLTLVTYVSLLEVLLQVGDFF